MKKLILVLVGFLFVVGCGKEDSKNANYKNIEAGQVFKEENLNGYFILDVRSRLEYGRGHIEDAVNVPLDELDENIIDLIPNKERKVLVYCQSGSRSKAASEKLVSYGYTNIYNMVGGMTAYDEVKV